MASCGVFFAPSNIKIEAVKAATAHVQPYYAVPAHFRPLDSFPENSNAKIDRRILEEHAKDALAADIVLARQASTSGGCSKASISPGFDLLIGEKESITISSLEEQKHIGYDCNENTFPKKTQGKIIRNLRHKFAFIFLVNFGILLTTIAKGDNAGDIGKIVIANLLVSILIRQDYVIDAFFTVPTS
ncbi:hypothetical protein H0H87_012553 [Tephrocybe sp. NHM501043]|nr:hypothetical protein H0H87_012553 [Tephrocybe sp. NHM501043]